MTIKTLEYIHKLLIEAEAETSKAYDAARTHQYEETGSMDWATKEKTIVATVADAMQRHLEALNALEAFESCEW